MNILHISRSMGQGGTEKIVYQLCMDKRKFKKQFVVSSGGVNVRKLEELGIKHYTIPDMQSKNPLVILKSLAILRKIINIEKIDIVHSHHRMAAFYAQLLKKEYKNLKIIYTAHSIFDDKVELLKFALRKTRVVAVGEGVKNNLVELYGIDSTNVTVIYNSIEREANIEIKINSKLDSFRNRDKYIIGNIGRISSVKGMDIFVKAIIEANKKNNNIVGVIVGDGEDRDKIEQLINEKNANQIICLLGYQENVFDIVSQLDFVVLSSRFEGFPLTPIEVFSMGKTIIATDVNGTREIVIDDYNGLLIEKDNIEQLTNKILFLIDNPKKYKEYEKNAKYTYENKFSYETFINKYNRIYEECT